MPDGQGIGYYLRPLSKHSLLIILLAAVAVVGGLITALSYGHLLPYEAQAVLLFKGNGSDRLVLTGQADFQANDIDPNREVRNLQALMSSVDVAEAVVADARASTDPDIQPLGTTDVLALAGATQVEVKGDLIYISAQADTPKAATWLANNWGAEAVTKVNHLYAVSSSRVSDALDESQKELTTAENELQEFLADSQLNSLKQELAQTNSFITSATESYTNTQFVLYNSERAAAQDKLADAYTSVYSLAQTTTEIQALRTRIEQGPDQPDVLYGNQISLIVLQNKMAAANAGADLQLQFNIGNNTATTLTKANQLSEIDAALAAAQKLQEDLQLQVQQLDTELQAPLPAPTAGTISNVPADLVEQIKRRNELESQIEQLIFQKDQLQKTRDLRQSTYDLLRNRLAEQQVNEVISRIVDVASPANELEAASSRSTTRLILLTVGQGLLLAVVLGIILAYLLHLWRPNFSTNSAFKNRFRRSSERVAPANSNG